jgi:hypothetical protein
MGDRTSLRHGKLSPPSATLLANMTIGSADSVDDRYSGDEMPSKTPTSKSSAGARRVQAATELLEQAHSLVIDAENMRVNGKPMGRDGKKAAHDYYAPQLAKLTARDKPVADRVVFALPNEAYALANWVTVSGGMAGTSPTAKQLARTATLPR